MSALCEFMWSGLGQTISLLLFIAGFAALIALEIFETKWGE